MIVRAHGRHLREPQTSEFRIVLPVTGTDVSRRAAEDAIMHAARRAGDLIVMGANRRAGSPLYLGEVATAVLQRSKASVTLVTN